MRLALVALPVKVYPATTSAGSRPVLHQIHAPSGKRVRHQKIVPGVGPVDTDEIVKGYEYEKGSYVLLDDEELDEIKIESRRTINLVQFVNLHEIDALYFETPFYVVPDGEEAEGGFVVIRDALRRAGKVALGQMALRGEETIVAVKPCGRGLLLETLRFAEEVRKADALFGDIEPMATDRQLVDLAVELIERKSGPFDPTAFTDHYKQAFFELIERKLGNRRGRAAGMAELPPPAGEIIDLADALEASVGRPRAGSRTGSRRSST